MRVYVPLGFGWRWERYYGAGHPWGRGQRLRSLGWQPVENGVYLGRLALHRDGRVAA